MCVFRVTYVCFATLFCSEFLDVKENVEMDVSKIVENAKKKAFVDDPDVPPLEFG
jgi:hypothetical protein